MTGEIPPELGGLSNLEWLYLSGNQLTGCISEGLRDIAENDLVELNLPDCGGATATPTQSALDRAALVALYHSTGGASWDANTNWLSDRPIGEWHGVTTNSNSRVVKVNTLECSGKQHDIAGYNYEVTGEVYANLEIEDVQVGFEEDIFGELGSGNWIYRGGVILEIRP